MAPLFVWIIEKYIRISKAERISLKYLLTEVKKKKTKEVLQ